MLRMKVCECCVISLDKRPSLRQWLVHCRLIDSCCYLLTQSRNFASRQKSHGKGEKLCKCCISWSNQIIQNEWFILTRMQNVSNTCVWYSAFSSKKNTKMKIGMWFTLCAGIGKCDSHCVEWTVFSNKMIVGGQLSESGVSHREIWVILLSDEHFVKN